MYFVVLKGFLEVNDFIGLKLKSELNYNKGLRIVKLCIV